MKLQEYQSKEFFAQYGIPVPPGKVASSAKEAVAIAQPLQFPVVVKAQVLVGGRGKAGGVKLCKNVEEVEAAASSILGMTIKGLTVTKILVAQAEEIAQEFYFSITLDRTAQRHIVMLSPSGGMDIEQVAEESPEKIFSLPVQGDSLYNFQLAELFFAAGLPSAALRSWLSLGKKSWQAYVDLDATLLEINPLALTPSQELVAVDAKVIVDDNSFFRQKELKVLEEEEEGIHPLEKEAKRRRLPYVKLGGEIGIIGNGAGLVMATMDLIKLFGGKPANFLDIGGGAKQEVVQNALDLVLSDPDVKGILFNVFGGITRGDEVAKGIIKVRENVSFRCPFVLRLAGTKAEEGAELLRAAGIPASTDLEEAAKKIVELTRP